MYLCQVQGVPSAGVTSRCPDQRHGTDSRSNCRRLRFPLTHSPKKSPNLICLAASTSEDFCLLGATQMDILIEWLIMTPYYIYAGVIQVTKGSSVNGVARYSPTGTTETNISNIRAALIREIASFLVISAPGKNYYLVVVQVSSHSRSLSGINANCRNKKLHPQIYQHLRTDRWRKNQDKYNSFIILYSWFHWPSLGLRDRLMPWLQLRFDYDTTTIWLRRIARPCFHSTRFDAS